MLADIADVLGRHQISIASVIQHDAPDPANGAIDGKSFVPLVIMTHRTTAGNLSAAAKEFAGFSSLRAPLVQLPVAN